MPQNPLSALVARNDAGAAKALLVDNAGALVVSVDSVDPSASSRLNITVPTVVKATPGKVITANVVVAGSTVGTINDCATTGAAAAANEIAALPDTVGPIHLDFPCLVGIVVVPGTGQTIAISFD